MLSVLIYAIARLSFRPSVRHTNGSVAVKDTIRYDTIEEINVDSKAEYTA